MRCDAGAESVERCNAGVDGTARCALGAYSRVDSRIPESGARAGFVRTGGSRRHAVCSRSRDMKNRQPRPLAVQRSHSAYFVPLVARLWQSVHASSDAPALGSAWPASATASGASNASLSRRIKSSTQGKRPFSGGHCLRRSPALPAALLRADGIDRRLPARILLGDHLLRFRRARPQHRFEAGLEHLFLELLVRPAGLRRTGDPL